MIPLSIPVMVCDCMAEGDRRCSSKCSLFNEQTSNTGRMVKGKQQNITENGRNLQGLSKGKNKGIDELINHTQVNRMKIRKLRKARSRGNRPTENKMKTRQNQTDS